MYKRMIVFFIMIQLILLSGCGKSFIDHEEIDVKVNAEYTIDQPYDYPVRPGTEAWKAFANQIQRLEVCQIPEDILQDMTTAALVETVLDYPLYIDMKLYNSYDQGVEAVKRQFNGLAELFTRQDAGIELLAKYRMLDIHALVTEWEKTADGSVLFSASDYEILLMQEGILENFSDEELIMVLEEAEKKYKDKGQYEDVYSGTRLISGLLVDRVEDMVASLSINQIESEEGSCENFEGEVIHDFIDVDNVKSISITYSTNRDMMKVFVDKACKKKLIDIIISDVLVQSTMEAHDFVITVGTAKEQNKVMIIEIVLERNGAAVNVFYGDEKQVCHISDQFFSEIMSYGMTSPIIPEDVELLFSEYNLSLGYQINKLTKQLPETFMHKMPDYPVSLFWAQRNELCKDIGLDIAPYLGKEIEVEIYYLNESVIEIFRPYERGRGIILRYENKIIGAYIDVVRNSTIAASLKMNQLEELVNKSYNEWVKDYADVDNNYEASLAKLSPIEAVELYYTSVEKADFNTAKSLLSREYLLSGMTMNIDFDKLYFDDYNPYFNIISLKYIGINKDLVFSQDNPNTYEYAVELDIDWDWEGVCTDGECIRFQIVSKESDKTGYKMNSFIGGTGP